jgi:putative hemolysin
VDPLAVIAGLDPAIPIMWHGGARLSGMAGSEPGHDQSVQTEHVLSRMTAARALIGDAEISFEHRGVGFERRTR